MPKVEIDYSNTIFYKIFCKDTNIKELYVGLTTNFVQRRHAHKQSCKNEKAMNHNCKLYNAIRNAGGWENWQIEIIAFHNCKDSYEAHKKEQEYFETLGATLNSIEPLPKPKIKASIVKIVKEKTILFCEPCNIHFSYWKAQETHNNTQKHHKMVTSMDKMQEILEKFPPKLELNKMPKNADFYCEHCHFRCFKKSNYIMHTNTKKHTYRLTGNEFVHAEIKINAKYKCECGKNYVTLSGLWKHKTKCCCVNNSNIVINHTDLHVQNSNNHASDKDELINYLIKENQEFKTMILEIVKKDSYNQHTTNITNTNSHNKTFNLQFFLNETCKDAMNMKDFIKSLELTMPELEKMGELGFAEGMSRVVVDRLNSLDITKRPIHCSDVKREIIHIKDDNKWERDNANFDRLRKIIKQLTHKNILKVDDWKKANPGCTEYNSRKNGQYLKLTMEAIGPVDDMEVKRDFGKIIRRVAETTAIDKKYLVV
jgi:hypothetical protein